MRYWLMKSEPEVFSIEDLETKGRSLWDGVRNYQARNFMTNDMKTGDLVLFYHSSCAEPGVVGLATVNGPATADPSQFDKKSAYFDPKAKRDKPTWFCVELAFEDKFSSPVSLKALRQQPELQGMALLQRGQRLSIQPVTESEFRHVQRLARN